VTLSRHPIRETVQRIINEEASRHLVSATLVTGASRTARAMVARNAAIRRILAETGCSERGLALVWGLEAATVRRARCWREPSLYDDNTLSRLQWAHGVERAASILAGIDPSTIADQAAWRGLGSRSA
jgi:hypothetical protein